MSTVMSSSSETETVTSQVQTNVTDSIRQIINIPKYDNSTLKPKPEVQKPSIIDDNQISIEINLSEINPAPIVKIDKVDNFVDLNQNSISYESKEDNYITTTENLIKSKIDKDILHGATTFANERNTLSKRLDIIENNQIDESTTLKPEETTTELEPKTTTKNNFIFETTTEFMNDYDLFTTEIIALETTTEIIEDFNLKTTTEMNQESTTEMDQESTTKFNQDLTTEFIEEATTEIDKDSTTNLGAVKETTTERVTYTTLLTKDEKNINEAISEATTIKQDEFSTISPHDQAIETTTEAGKFEADNLESLARTIGTLSTDDDDVGDNLPDLKPKVYFDQPSLVARKDTTTRNFLTENKEPDELDDRMDQTSHGSFYSEVVAIEETLLSPPRIHHQIYVDNYSQQDLFLENNELLPTNKSSELSHSWKTDFKAETEENSVDIGDIAEINDSINEIVSVEHMESDDRLFRTNKNDQNNLWDTELRVTINITEAEDGRKKRKIDQDRDVKGSFQINLTPLTSPLT